MKGEIKLRVGRDGRFAKLFSDNFGLKINTLVSQFCSHILRQWKPRKLGVKIRSIGIFGIFRKTRILPNIKYIK
jgi:hypothetical protein